MSTMALEGGIVVNRPELCWRETVSVSSKDVWTATSGTKGQ
jgi:hypothetical protein